MACMAACKVTLERLFYYGGCQSNRRHKGGFPNYTQVALKRNKSVNHSVKRAQELLIQYGELMVEQGLLLE